MIPMSSDTNLSSSVYPALRRAATDAWVGGLAFTQKALSEQIARDLTEPPEEVAQSLPQFLAVLERRGIYTAQRAKHGSKTAGDGLLTSPQCFNWSTLAPDAATLRHAVEPFLTDETVADHRKHAVRSALRFILELPTKCADAVLLQACERVSAAELYLLPGRTYDAALAPPNPLRQQTAANHRAAIRSVMRYAADRQLVPIVFPRIWNDDAWERDKERFFPLEVDGPTPHKISNFRSAWTVFGATFAAMHPDQPNELASVTREIAEAVITRMQVHDGRYAVGYAARGALRYIAERFGAGPFAVASAADVFMVQTPSGRRPAVYLRGPNSEAADGDWDKLFAILEHHQLPASLVNFLRWYRVYVTADVKTITANKSQFPPRRRGLQIDENTLNQRIPALRAFLGAAIYELRPGDAAAPLGLSLNPPTLEADEVFGFRFQAILHALRSWWEARAEALPDGAVGKSGSGGLRQMVISLGMIALAYYEYLRHQRQMRISVRAMSNGRERIDWRSEQEVPKSAAEQAAWDAYRDAGVNADELAGQTVRGARNGRTHRQNDYKDIRRIVENTPPAYWIALLQFMLAEMRESKKAGNDHGYAYHTNVLNAFMLGLLISTGCRIEELCHVRLDIQGKDLRTKRIIRLRAIDRKNSRAHDVLVQPEFVPDDLLNEYLDITRPWFIEGRHGQSLHQGFTRRPRLTTREPVKPHEWLLISTSGRPFGCREEKSDGTGRKKYAFKRRCAQAGLRFKVQMSSVALAAKKLLPGTRYEFGPHAVRGSCGYGVFLMFGDAGVQKAAHYLGDKEDTVREAYSSINGLHVDSSCLVGLDMRPQLNTARETRPRRGSAVTLELHGLVDSFENGMIDAATLLKRAQFALSESSPSVAVV